MKKRFTITFYLIFYFCTASSAINIKEFNIAETEPYYTNQILFLKHKDREKFNFIKGMDKFNSLDYDSALHYFKESIKNFPYKNRSYYWLAEVYSKLGEYGNAVKYLERVLVDDTSSEFIKNKIAFMQEEDTRLELLVKKLGYLEWNKGLTGENKKKNFEYEKVTEYSGDKWDVDRFISPIDLKVYDKNIYVLARGSANLIVIDKSGRLLKEYHELDKPYGFDIDDEGYIYITEFDKNVIVKLDNNLSLVNEIKENFLGPQRIIVEGNYIYVVDSGNNRIVKLTKEGKFLLEISGYKNGFFKSAVDIVFDNNEVLYVLDDKTSKLAGFDRSGNMIKTVDLNSGLKSPKKIIFREGKFFISDYYETGFIHVLAKDGTYLNKLSLVETVFLNDFDTDKIYIFNADGRFDSKPDEPLKKDGDVIDIGHNLVKIVDTSDNYRLRLFDKNDFFVYNSSLRADNVLSFDIDEEGNLYTVENFKNSLMIYKKMSLKKERINLSIDKIQTTLYPLVIQRFYVTDSNGRAVSDLEKDNFTIYEGFPHLESPEFVDYDSFDEPGDTRYFDFRRNFMPFPFTVKHLSEYVKDQYIVLLIHNDMRLKKDFELVKKFIGELLDAIDYRNKKIRVCYFSPSGGTKKNRDTIEVMMDFTTDKFEIKRRLDKLKFYDIGNDYIDKIYTVANNILKKNGYRKIMYIDSNMEPFKIKYNDKIKKEIRFINNNHIKTVFVNFHREKSDINRKIAVLLKGHAYNYIDLELKSVIKEINNVTQNQYIGFYQSMFKGLQTYTWQNVYIELKYLNKRFGLRSGYLVP